MASELIGSINGGLSKEPVKGPTISPCRFCGGNHWNDRCMVYCTAGDRKQLLKFRCYICLKSGHRAFECKVQKTCYFCGRRNHHHRSLCETKFGTLQKGRAELGNILGNKTQTTLNCGQNNEGVSQDSKSSSTKSSCSIQVMDSEDDVYVPQTNMEVEFALTINKQQAELERYKNENFILKQTVLKLEKENETINRTVSKNAEDTKVQLGEIAQFRERLEQSENNRDEFHRLQQIIRFIEPNTNEINARRQTETQTHNEAHKSTAKSTYRHTMVNEQDLIKDVDHGLEEIKMLIQRQGHIMQNSELSTGDIQPFEEQNAYTWSTLLKSIADNIRLQKDMHHLPLKQTDIRY